MWQHMFDTINFVLKYFIVFIKNHIDIRSFNTPTQTRTNTHKKQLFLVQKIWSTSNLTFWKELNCIWFLTVNLITPSYIYMKYTFTILLRFWHIKSVGNIENKEYNTAALSVKKLKTPIKSYTYSINMINVKNIRM